MNVTVAGTATWPVLGRVRRAIVVVDVVESVRLMQNYEADVIDRWRRFVAEVRKDVLPRYGGRLVKSLGDGMLLEFERVPEATSAAFDIQRRVRSYNVGRADDAAILLRVGSHVGEVVIDDLDVHGMAVNLAARVAGLARAGECVASVEFRDELTAGLDADVDDLGDCYVKHIEGPVRCCILRPVDTSLPAYPAPAPGKAAVAQFMPTIAVRSFADRRDPASAAAIGDAIADDIIAALSVRREWRVIARASMAAFRGATTPLSTLGPAVRADYVVDGRYVRSGPTLAVYAALTEVRSSAVLWSTDQRIAIDDLFAAADALIPEIVGAVARTVADTEMQRARALPLHNLEDYSLYTAGLGLLNRLSLTDFTRARALLSHLADRVPRSAAPHSLMAKWHILRLTQGWAEDRAAEASLARVHARRALQLEPDHAYALAVDGLVAVQTDRDLDAARSAYLLAIAANPQEPYAWAALSGLHSYCDEVEPAQAAARHALALSPLDPHRFMYEAYLATALLRAGEYTAAVEHARASLRLNRHLSAGYRILAIALVHHGEVEMAREVVRQLLVYEPQQTLRRYAEQYPGRGAAHLAEYVTALRVAGVPE